MLGWGEGERGVLLHTRTCSGPCFPLWMTDTDPIPTAAVLLQASPQTTSFGSSVCEKARKLEKSPPNASLLNHALMYISTSQPLAIKTYTQICPPKTCLKIDIVLKQTHRLGKSKS